jgi:glycosyltransferase involved in cell wall biosynthesis
MWMKPLVSVITLTYNHAPYIRQSIEGILMQKTTFAFELVIGEDCSTDGTREIVLEYFHKYPEIIKVVTSATNVGAIENLKRTNLACQGEYIAVCEGDDYWTDQSKLQKQIDFLENHPDFSMCCHASKIVIEDDVRQPEIMRLADTDKTFTIDDFLAPLSKNFIRTDTVVFKRAILRDFNERNQRIVLFDYPLFLILAYHGNIRYLDQVMSVYRKHGGGIWTSNSGKAVFLEKYYLSTIEMYKAFDEYSDHHYHERIQKRISYRYYQFIENFNHNEKQLRDYFFKYWDKLPFHLMVKIFVTLYLILPMRWIRNHIVIHR